MHRSLYRNITHTSHTPYLTPLPPRTSLFVYLCGMNWKEVRVLLRKELMIEWKQKYAFNGLLLYVLSMVVVIALAFVNQLNPISWNILYWIMILFVAINAVAKSFLGEKKGNLLLLYSLAGAASVIVAKLIYNTGLLILVALLTLLVFSFLGEISIAFPWLLVGVVALGSMSLAANLTLMTAIASRAENQSTILAVLSFPVIIPSLLMLIRLSRYAIDGFGEDSLQDGFLLLGGITLVLSMVSVVLFPFLWRD